MATTKSKIIDDKKAHISRHPNLTQFIRSIQRIEGKLDCFARIDTVCDSQDCQWHIYCLKELKKIKGKSHEH
jgi:hypothetical protein